MLKRKKTFKLGRKRKKNNLLINNYKNYMDLCTFNNFFKLITYNRIEKKKQHSNKVETTLIKINLST